MGIPHDGDKGLIKFIDDQIHEALDIASRKHLKDGDVLKEIIRATARKASKRFSGKQTGPVTKITLSRIN
jgi:hypothetical protein